MVSINLCREICKFLFPEYPREVVVVTRDNLRGNKYFVRNYRELVKISSIYSGFSDIYTRLYYSVLNKVFFDIDADNLYDAYLELVDFTKYLEREDILYIPVFSGGKGFHIYVLTKRMVFTKEEENLVKYFLTTIQRYFIEEVGLKHVDSKLIGSVKHLVRVPNTKRSNQRYSVYLPQKIYKYSLDEIIEMSSLPKCFSLMNYSGEPLDLYEYVSTSLFHELHEPSIAPPDPSNIGKYDKRSIYLILSNLIRPCILNHVFTENPDHDIRTYFVIELKWCLFNQGEIEEIISKLNWSDYNPHVTHYHVSKIFEKNLYPPSCSTIQTKGYCLREKCLHYPSYPYIYLSDVF